jgi:arginyl-tRNA--protein-N-Asp/Glu arginylyltransferase
VRDIRLFQIPEHACSYLEDQTASTVFIDPELPLDRGLISALSRIGFRRSGEHVYRPHCANCRACVPTRIIASAFKPSRGQRRILAKNQGLSMHIEMPSNSDEIYSLYAQYISVRHQDGDMYPPSRSQFESFLLAPAPTVRFISFRRGHKLLAVMVGDELDDGWSAVYSFFDPEEAGQSLGTYMILKLIEITARSDAGYVYLGYHIEDCNKMNYKLNFSPSEQLIDDRWITALRT